MGKGEFDEEGGCDEVGEEEGGEGVGGGFVGGVVFFGDGVGWGGCKIWSMRWDGYMKGIYLWWEWYGIGVRLFGKGYVYIVDGRF